MLDNKAEIARESIKTTLELPGPTQRALDAATGGGGGGPGEHVPLSNSRCPPEKSVIHIIFICQYRVCVNTLHLHKNHG